MRYEVSGIFVLKIEAENEQEARTEAQLILREKGIDGYVIQVEERREGSAGSQGFYQSGGG